MDRPCINLQPCTVYFDCVLHSLWYEMLYCFSDSCAQIVIKTGHIIMPCALHFESSEFKVVLEVDIASGACTATSICHHSLCLFLDTLLHFLLQDCK